MAEDEKNDRPTRTPPSLLTPCATEREAGPGARILAALEGRAPEAESRHLSPKRKPGRAPWAALALLLLVGAGAVSWFTLQESEPAIQVAETQTPAAADGQAYAPGQRETAPPLPGATPPAVASIVDESPPAPSLEPAAPEPEPANPLAMLANTTPPAAAPGPTRQAAANSAAASVQAAKAEGAPAGSAKNDNQAGPRKAKPAPAAPRKGNGKDSDAALLSALMDYGLPPASPPGTRVYKSDGVFMRVMPGSPLAERLSECRKLGFLEGEQCRLRNCAGHWGTAPECPTPQATVEP